MHCELSTFCDHELIAARGRQWEEPFYRQDASETKSYAEDDMVFDDTAEKRPGQLHVGPNTVILRMTGPECAK
ncbi:uncharacterized protein SPSK_10100 [Sporothrix schenckii 1099-18]|uniref:Uncharacterized protein n=1 Tax=Sporothrix schenckii 1099-18 TaxID=1397361 RepID=A0A0F2M868_SPOSC|nr:uncharacterized protein SPSK_10100 [Sporothrix schenckii 1099-18]KJR84995.1 hypothetical protein SPSK_10100 [Sporothrix schenckii 1099-18]